MEQAIDYEKLGQAIASAIRATPANHDLWDATDVANHLRCSKSHVSQRYTCQPGFPPKIRIPYKKDRGGEPGLGKALWVASEVQEWALKHQSKTGRKREN